MCAHIHTLYKIWARLWFYLIYSTWKINIKLFNYEHYRKSIKKDSVLYHMTDEKLFIPPFDQLNCPSWKVVSLNEVCLFYRVEMVLMGTIILAQIVKKMRLWSCNNILKAVLKALSISLYLSKFINQKS